jgi:hypothetical protein
LKKNFSEGSFSLHGEVSFGDIRKCSSSADLCTKGLTIAKVTGHGPFGDGVENRSAVRTSIETGFTTDTPFFIRHDCAGFGDALPGTGRADRHARGFFAVLTDDGHEDRNLFPLLHPYPRKGRTAGAFVGKAADHFTGMAAGAVFRDNGNGGHLRDLLISFVTMNIQLKAILSYFQLLSSFF